MATVGARAASAANQLDHGHVRLVHVDDVVAAVAQLPAEQSNRLGEDDRLVTAPFIGRPKVRPSGIR